MKNKAKKNKAASNTISLNKRARHEYHIEEKMEAGMALQGWEVKALRAGKVNLSEAYVLMKDQEAFLFGCTVTPLQVASTHKATDPLRTRKLLLKRREIDRLQGMIQRQGYTLVPTAMYWKKSYVKLEIGLAKGKTNYDKRADLKDQQWQREKARLLKNNTKPT